MKFIITSYIFFSIAVFCSAQVKNDTLDIQVSIINDFYNLRPNSGGGIYRVNEDTVSKEVFQKAMEKFNYIKKYVRDSVNGHYCRFYEDTILLEEVMWFIEGQTGPYKRYHQNGKLEISGEYSGPGNKYSYAQKIGVWNYYTEEGKLYKKEIYNQKGKLLKIKKN